MYVLLSLFLLNLVVALFITACMPYGADFTFVNPFVLYKHVRANWFGIGLLTIILNVCLPIISIPYWFYKICTVGRSDSDEMDH